MRRAAAWVALACALAGCRAGEGERCFENADCRGGLLCAEDGVVLEDGQRTMDSEAGVCVEQGEIVGDEMVPPPPPWFDGSKRDFAPFEEPWPTTSTTAATSTATEASGVTSTGTAETGASSTGIASTGSTASASTGSSSTGSGSTGVAADEGSTGIPATGSTGTAAPE